MMSNLENASRADDPMTVILATWNRASDLPRAIASVAAQQNRIALLVCDDGSTDHSRACFTNREWGDWANWLPGSHSGLPAVPRNRGIAAAEGTWVAFLDSDDEWLPHKSESQLRHIGRLGAACSNATRVDGAAKEDERPYLSRRRTRITWHDLLRSNDIITSTVVVRTSIIRAAGGFPESPDLRALEDLALWLRIATYTDFAYVPECLARYTDHPAASIRGQVLLSEDEVYEKVLADFVSWADSTPGKQRYAAVARKALRLGAWGRHLSVPGRLRRVLTGATTACRRILGVGEPADEDRHA